MNQSSGVVINTEKPFFLEYLVISWGERSFRLWQEQASKGG